MQLLFLIPSELKPHEHVRPFRVCTLILRFVLAGHFTHPLLVDASSRTILDGHHRWCAARALGFAKIPCFAVDYLRDDSVTVTPRRPRIVVTKELVVQKALAGERFPHKTTRHEYALPVFEPVPLALLRV